MSPNSGQDARSQAGKKSGPGSLFAKSSADATQQPQITGGSLSNYNTNLPQSTHAHNSSHDMRFQGTFSSNPGEQ